MWRSRSTIRGGQTGHPLAMMLTDVLSLPFEWAAALRHRRKAFHPDGVLLSGTVTRLAEPGRGLPLVSGPVVARLSKALGTPGGLPDVAGLAWRMPIGTDSGGAWDMLLASAASHVVGRSVPLPVRSWNDALFSSIAPFAYDGGAWWVRARMITQVPPKELSLNSIRGRARLGAIDVAVEQARGAGDFHPLARLHLDRSSDTRDVSFDPVGNEAPGVTLMPAWLTLLRRAAYRRSRQGRQAQ